VIEPVCAQTQTAALEYLSRAPYLNVFISHVLLHDTQPARRNVAVVLEGGQIRGVAYYGRQLAIAADAVAIGAFGEYAKRRRGERMIVGPRETVRDFWRTLRSWHPDPRLVRDRQLVMMIDRARLRPYEPSVTVGRARSEEWRAIADGSAEMIRQELDYDPRRGSPEFMQGIRQMIARKLWWVGRTNGRLCFFCNVGPWCDRTVQLQGIWTPPDLRHRGLATASLAAICDRLLEVSPTLSLYVNDFNAPAIALSERVGFRRAGEFASVIF